MIHYIIARRDLDPDRVVNKDWLPPPSGISTLGITAAQVTHAAGESFARWVWSKAIGPTCLSVPFPVYTTAVVLGVPNQRALLRLEKRLQDANIPHVAIREPDAPWNGQLMTIGLWPVDKKSDILKRLKLL